MADQSTCRVLDTWADFQTWWATACEQDLHAQIQSWHDVYMAAYPELLQIQLEDYAELGYDWRQVAAEHIWPYLADWLPAMETAHQNLLEVTPQVCRRVQERLSMDLRPTIVLYVGIGHGAGSATRYQGGPACLMGLEMVAENHWQDPGLLRGLLAHELGHLLHMHWRGEWARFLEQEEDPFFLLYSEGFAQHCEDLLYGQPWHLLQDEDWLPWCREQQGWLAGEYLRRVQDGETVREFYGSWYELRGQKQTGYFLGQAWIQEMWAQGQALGEIARWPLEQVRRQGHAWLQHQATVGHL